MRRLCKYVCAQSLLWLAGGAIAFAQGLPPTLQPIEAYLDARTKLIAWLDPNSVSIKDVRDLQQVMTGLNSESELESLINTIKSLEIERLVVLSEDYLIHAPNNFVFVVFCERPKDTLADIRDMFPPTLASKQEGNRLLLSTSQAAIDQILSKEGEMDRDMRRRLEASNAPNGCMLHLQADSPDVAKFREAFESSTRLNQVLESLPRKMNFLVQGTIPIPASIDVESFDIDEAAKFANSLRELLKPNRGEETSLVLATDGTRTRLIVSENSHWKAVRDKVFSSTVRTNQSFNNLRQLLLAMHNFADVHGALPPQSLTDKDGNKLLSWRVTLLPYLEENELYQQFHLDEPWDSPHNQSLIEKMPQVFKDPLDFENASKGKTRYVVPLTANSIFGRPGKPMKVSQIKDGLSNTIAMMEVGSQASVIWTKPDDVVIGPGDTLAKFVDADDKAMIVGLADGSVRRLRITLSKETVQAMVGADDGVLIDEKDWQP